MFRLFNRFCPFSFNSFALSDNRRLLLGVLGTLSDEGDLLHYWSLRSTVDSAPMIGIFASLSDDADLLHYWSARSTIPRF